MNQLNRNIIAKIKSLPPSFGYNLHKILFLKRFRKIQVKRRNRPITADSYALKPFDDHHCIFIRIPKCGTQSIATSLFGNLGYGHKTLMDYQLIFDPKTFDQYFKFAFVRNPLDRLASAFFFLKKDGFSKRDKAFNQEYLTRYKDFDDFVENGLRTPGILGYIHFIPQYKYVCDRNGKIATNFIGKLENVEQDFKYICSQLKIERQLTTRNTNREKKRPYRDLCSEKSIQIIKEVYKKDFELFDYAT